MGCIPREREPVAQGPCPFGPSLSTRFGWSVLTTVQKHVRVPTHSDLAHRPAPSGSGFSCFAPLARPMPLGVRQRHEGGAITSAPLRWELDGGPHPHAQQVLKGSHEPLAPIPLDRSKFRENGSQPPPNRTGPFRCHPALQRSLCRRSILRRVSCDFSKSTLLGSERDLLRPFPVSYALP
jgi:hypothetical protein